MNNFWGCVGLSNLKGKIERHQERRNTHATRSCHMKHLNRRSNANRRVIEYFSCFSLDPERIRDQL